MRLVDADSLKEIISENEKWVLELIDDIPTACDIDKMIEQLESNSYMTDNTYDEDGFSNDDSDEVINLSDAIRTVKERGV